MQRYLPPENSIATIYPGAADLALNPHDADVFPPNDPWTLALAEALRVKAEQGNLDGKKIMELGSGSGVHMLGLKAMEMAVTRIFFKKPPSYIGLDIACESVAACESLRKAYGFEGVSLFESNLLRDVPPEHLEGTNVVFACLPQVRWDFDAAQRAPLPRELADYYVPDGPEVPEDAYGLGLVARALDEIRERLPNASVLFNVAGRQGPKAEEVFSSRFEHVRSIVDRVIPHDPGTSLTSFVKWEQETGERCRFSTAENFSPETQICAEEAEDRRLSGEPVYHELFVVEAFDHEP